MRARMFSGDKPTITFADGRARLDPRSIMTTPVFPDRFNLADYLLFDRVREGQIVYEAIDWAHPLHGRFFEMNRPIRPSR